MDPSLTLSPRRGPLLTPEQVADPFWLVCLVVTCTPPGNNIVVLCELAGDNKHACSTTIFYQVSSCGCRAFHSCHPKQALAGVGQPGGRAGVSAAWHMHGVRSEPELCPCCAGAVPEPIRQSGASGRARYGMGGGRAGRPGQLLLG